MPFITWHDEFCLNIAAIDTQHKALVEMLNRFHAAVSREEDREILLEILEELIDNTNYHFRDEEKTMMEMGYAGLEDHRRKHNEFEAAGLEYYSRLKDNEAVDLHKFMTFIKNWMVEHMLIEDRRIGDVWRQKCEPDTIT